MANKRPKIWCADDIHTRPQDVGAQKNPGDLAHARMGGISLWAADHERLRLALGDMQDGIEHILRDHLTVARPVLVKLLRERLDEGSLSDRIIGGVLGAAMRRGLADTLICASKFDKPFRVYVSEENLPRLHGAFDVAARLLQSAGHLTVPELEVRIFGQRRYNTWSSASHVLGHLSYRGVVEMTEGGAYSLVKGLF